MDASTVVFGYDPATPQHGAKPHSAGSPKGMGGRKYSKGKSRESLSRTGSRDNLGDHRDDAWTIYDDYSTIYDDAWTI